MRCIEDLNHSLTILRSNYIDTGDFQLSMYPELNYKEGKSFIEKTIFYDKNNIPKQFFTSFEKYEYRKEECERIVKEFSDVLKKLGENQIAKPISLLKKNKEEIKEAHRDFLIALNEDNLLTNEIYQDLSAAFFVIDTFVNDSTANTINRVNSLKKEKQPIMPQDEKAYTEFMQNTFSKISDKMAEFEKILKG